MITGATQLIAQFGFPTEHFKAPMMFNPYFERERIDVVVMPMGCRTEDYPEFLKLTFRLSNIRGAIVTMPHKIATAELVDALSPTASIAGACNAVRREVDGRLMGEMLDGEGFVRAMLRTGRAIAGQRAIIIGSGGVGRAIAASLAKAGVAELALFDTHAAATAELSQRLTHAYPRLQVTTGSNDPKGFDIVINATPLGLQAGDPLAADVTRIDPTAFVGDVVMAQTMTPFLQAARARGCAIQIGTDMLFEQAPAYLEFFGLAPTSAEDLRSIARLY